MARRSYTDTPWKRAHLLKAPNENTVSSHYRWQLIFAYVTRLVTLYEATFVWRGHSDVNWLVTPSLHRKMGVTPGEAADGIDVDGEVSRLLKRAQDLRYDRIDGWDSLPDLPLLALLQHTGAATPLLDVTTDPMVALYFACQPNFGAEQETDGLLLAINVHPKQSKHFEVGDPFTWPDALSQLDDDGFSIGVYTPPIVTSRIMAQRGRFIFGRQVTDIPYTTLPLTYSPPLPGKRWRQRADWSHERLHILFGTKGSAGRILIPPVVGILVPARWKRVVREVLELTYGLNAETLFPDLPGFAAAHGIGGRPLTEQPIPAQPWKGPGA